MAIQKNITIDGIEVPFKASAAVPRLYRLKFRRDIYQDFAALQKSVGENTEESSALDIESLEVFENIAYIMAKHADPAVPASPDEWLEQFNTFSIYEILPQLIDLWGLNVETQVKSKQNRFYRTDQCGTGVSFHYHFLHFLNYSAVSIRRDFFLPSVRR